MTPSGTLALQLYSVRELGSLDAMLGAARDAGYHAVQTARLHGVDADVLATALERHRLIGVSSHVGLDELQHDLDTCLQTYGQLGHRSLVIPSLPADLRGGSSERWQETGRLLGDLGRRCRQAGFRLGYHNHAFELSRVDGRYAIEWLLDSAAPEDLGFEPDLGWIARAGADPLPLLERYEGRTELVHVKDYDPGKQSEDGWADVGHGVLDWTVLLPAVAAAGATVYVVEHDEPADPAASARRSAQYLRTTFPDIV